MRHYHLEDCLIITMRLQTGCMLQQLGTDVFNYEVMAEVQANKYTAADGSKPFSAAPDSLRVSCSWKAVWSQSLSVPVHIKNPAIGNLESGPASLRLSLI